MKNKTVRTQNNCINLLLACGVAGGPLFVSVFLIQGILRDNYKPFEHPVSSLSIGENGWIQVLNFIISGVLLCVFAVGLYKTFKTSIGKAPHLIALVGIGLIGAGFFPTDPVFGYPINQPLALAQFTITGHLHDFFSLPVFIGLPWACFLFRKWFIKNGNKGWAAYSLLTSIIMLISFILAGIGFKQLVKLTELAGLFQRISIISGCLWISLLSAYLLKQKPTFI